MSHTDVATRICLSGWLGHEAVDRLHDVLASLPSDSPGPVLVRITSSEWEFGVGDALRKVLTSCRRAISRQLAVWADEPLIRRGIPMALLHMTPPQCGGSWEVAVPVPS